MPRRADGILGESADTTDGGSAGQRNLIRTGTKPMPANSQMRAGGEPLRWTPAWVLTISFLTPASAWALHSVMPDMVAWYVGVMGWLILTPEKVMRLRLSQVQADPNARNANGLQKQVEPAATSLKSPTEATEHASGADTASAETNAAKAKKSRSRARKPKALTLAEVKALTGSADRAVVWSQVGPGKFVRSPGEENGDQGSEGDSNLSAEPDHGSQVIEAVARTTTVLKDDDAETADDDDRA